LLWLFCSAAGTGSAGREPRLNNFMGECHLKDMD
jgi:hypothetical protein